MDLVEKMSEKKSSSSSSSKTSAFVSVSIHYCHSVATFIALCWSSFLFNNTTYIHISANGPVVLCVMPPEIKECQKVNLLKNVKLFLLHFTHPSEAWSATIHTFFSSFLCANQPMGHQFYFIPFTTPTIFSPFFAPFADDI